MAETEVKFKRKSKLEIDSTPIEDGSILFSTDTQEIFMDNGKERQEYNGVEIDDTLTKSEKAADAKVVGDKLKEKATYYNSVEEMKSDNSLKDGDVAVTLGYYEPNDGGGATYLIRVKTDGDIDDGGSIHELNNGNVAELIVEEYVTPEMFGAKGDGVTDDTETFQKCLNYSKCIHFKNKYLISSPLYIEKKCILDGENYGVIYNNCEEYCIYNCYGRTVLKNFELSGNGKKGILYKNINRQGFTEVSNVTFKNCKNSINFNTIGGYNNFYNCSFYHTDIEEEVIDVIIGCEDGFGSNYIKIIQCNFEGSNKETKYNSILINQGSVIDIIECDFANNLSDSYCILLNNKINGINNITIKGNKFWNCKYGIDIKREYETSAMYLFNIYNNLIYMVNNGIFLNCYNEISVQGIYIKDNTIYATNKSNFEYLIKMKLAKSVKIGSFIVPKYSSDTISPLCSMVEYSQCEITEKPNTNKLYSFDSTTGETNSHTFIVDDIALPLENYIPVKYTNHETGDDNIKLKNIEINNSTGEYKVNYETTNQYYRKFTIMLI